MAQQHGPTAPVVAIGKRNGNVQLDYALVRVVGAFWRTAEWYTAQAASNTPSGASPAVGGQSEAAGTSGAAPERAQQRAQVRPQGPCAAAGRAAAVHGGRAGSERERGVGPPASSPSVQCRSRPAANCCRPALLSCLRRCRRCTSNSCACRPTCCATTRQTVRCPSSPLPAPTS